jgi:hypothetical protein
MDMVRSSLDAPDFLDYIPSLNRHVGIVNDWQIRSAQMGLPITHWIIEDNAAQRFMLQHDYFKLWMRSNKVVVIPHTTTGANKLDPDYGIQMLKNVYYHGLCRFPGTTPGRFMAKPLYNEVTRYPEPGTDDCLMAQWFLEYNLAKITKPPVRVEKLARPTWLRRSA